MNITEQIISHYTLEEGDYNIQLTIADHDCVGIKTYKGDREFIFDNFYNEGTLDKWEAVLKLMQEAVKIAREKLKVKEE